jgi:hypothetical protein
MNATEREQLPVDIQMRLLTLLEELPWFDLNKVSSDKFALIGRTLLSVIADVQRLQVEVHYMQDAFNEHSADVLRWQKDMTQRQLDAQKTLETIANAVVVQKVDGAIRWERLSKQLGLIGVGVVLLVAIAHNNIDLNVLLRLLGF